MEGTYNPPKLGRAYYFSSLGCQMREVRKFPIDSDTSSENFDDAPDLLCAKRLPQVRKQSTSYLFLWFCPQHGHCYGYHIIHGSEGRKDAATSLYTQIETAPDVIFMTLHAVSPSIVATENQDIFKTLDSTTIYFMALVINAHLLSVVVNYGVSKQLVLGSASNLTVLYKMLKLQRS